MREYLDRNSEGAFAELVQRHINLVYSVAVRHVGNSQDAQDVAQAVFVILIRKAASLRHRTTLTGWLYETTRLSARQLLRTRARQQAREQEAYMQSTLNEPDTGDVWKQLAPILEEAMTRLTEKERTLLALRFFENKSAAETAALLGIQEWAARKRASRAVEKLRRFFYQRGVAVPAAILTSAISANSLQAAPAALAKAATAVALAKGATASTSILTLTKGALKIMAWTKTKTAIVAVAGLLFAAATATMVVKTTKAQDANDGDAWRVSNLNSKLVMQAPPEVEILPTKFHGAEHRIIGVSGNRFAGIRVSVSDLIGVAYGTTQARISFTGVEPEDRYDFITTVSQDPVKALQQELKQKLGLVGRRQTRETDVLLLKVKQANAAGLKPRTRGFEMLTSPGRISGVDQPISMLVVSLENSFKTPILDRTGLGQQTFNFDIRWDESRGGPPNPDGLKGALLEQLGLELVSAHERIEVLVVENEQ